MKYIAKLAREQRNLNYKNHETFRPKSYDLTALGFAVVILQRWGFQL